MFFNKYYIAVYYLNVEIYLISPTSHLAGNESQFLGLMNMQSPEVQKIDSFLQPSYTRTDCCRVQEWLHREMIRRAASRLVKGLRGQTDKAQFRALGLRTAENGLVGTQHYKRHN